MESIKEIFRIGYGPSSSHTMGPRKAAEVFKSKNPDANSYSVTLYGSLAATGKGHQTDNALTEALLPHKVVINWEPDTFLPLHPNGLKLEALFNGKVISEWTVYSIGGGKITDLSTDESENKVYELTTMKDILQWTKKTGRSFWEYVEDTEGKEIYDHLAEVWKVMLNAIARGVDNDGILPGGL
jgi:L-serine dehydratase